MESLSNSAKNKTLLHPIYWQRVLTGYWVFCPGCKKRHVLNVNHPKGPNFQFNRNMGKPTFYPYTLVHYGYGPNGLVQKCHSEIHQGVWFFYTDCDHDLAGKQVAMVAA